MKKQKKAYRLPIKISENGRYFVDSENKPFFFFFATCCKPFWEFTYDEAQEYLINRADTGFTVIQVHLLPHRIYQANRDGNSPFLERGNITKVNESYFKSLDLHF